MNFLQRPIPPEFSPCSARDKELVMAIEMETIDCKLSVQT